MPKGYKQLTIHQRLVIGYYLSKGATQTEIAKQIGVHRSTISRELKRNNDPQWDYHILLADEKAEKRKERFKQRKLDRYPSLKKYVINGLKKGLSPAQIVGREKYLTGYQSLCHETIYAYIYSLNGRWEKLYQWLPSRRKKRFPRVTRKKHAPVANRVSIHERPETANNREEFGHWECDLMQFSKKTKTNLITLRERKTRYIVAMKNESRQADVTIDKLIKWLIFEHKNVKSITFDNGPEFARHDQLRKQFKIKTYFCDPYKSYQKGSIENANRLIRQHLPRDYPIEELPHDELRDLVSSLNSKPLKCLDYQHATGAYFHLNERLKS